MKVCRKCKKKVANNAKVCKYCGADVSKIKPLNKPNTTTTKKAAKPKETDIDKKQPIKKEVSTSKKTSTKTQQPKKVETKNTKTTKTVTPKNNVKKPKEVKEETKIEVKEEIKEEVSVEQKELKINKKDFKSIIKELLNYVKKYLIIIGKFISKWSNIIWKKTVTFTKKLGTKIKELINKSKTKIKEKQNEPKKESKLIKHKLSSGILKEVEEGQKKVSYHTTTGLPVLTEEQINNYIPEQEKIEKKEKYDFKKVLLSIWSFIKKIGNTFKNLFNSIKNIKNKKRSRNQELKEDKSLKEEVETNIKKEKKEEQEESEEDEEDEFDGYSIKKIILFLLLLAVLVVGAYFGIRSLSNSSIDPSIIKITDKTKKKTYNMKETLSYKGINYTITKAYISSGTQYRKPKEGNEFIVIMIEYLNNSKDKIKYSYQNWKLENSKGEEVGRIFTPINVNTALYSGSLVIGAQKKGSLVFEEPKEDKNLILNYYSDKQVGEMEKLKEEQQKEKEEKEKNGEEYQEKELKKQTPIFSIKIIPDRSKDYNEQTNEK